MIAAFFYILATVLSLILMNSDDSIFHTGSSFFFRGKETADVEVSEIASPEAPSGPVNQEKEENREDDGDEEENGVPSEPSAEAEQAKTMVMGEEGNIEVQSGVLAEPAPDAAADEDTQEPAEPPKKYYRFTTINTDGGLRIREEPDVNSPSIFELPPGSEGYVLELGDDWSYIAADEHVGYCSNEFLSLTEIPEEEYPEALR